jgi:hypothetical protein
MGIPKKIKKNIHFINSKTPLERREELVDKINYKGTYLPKSILHADLDKGFLEFVKNDLYTSVDGTVIPMVDILITTQNWSQFVETWDIQNIDKNSEPPFITVVRIPEVKFGTNPAVQYNIPNRRLYFYAQVPTWDGQRSGMDIYKIPQPVPVDISFNVKIVCNRMAELNEFNKVVNEKFASLQAYTVIKGHYIPIVNGAISDESIMEIEKRKYYIQSYEFNMLGFLIDENQFEVSPAISRTLTVTEISTNKSKKRLKNDNNPSSTEFLYGYDIGEVTKSFKIDYTADLTISSLDNVLSYDVYIDENFYGSDLTKIQINTNETLRVTIVKTNPSKESSITFLNVLL